MAEKNQENPTSERYTCINCGKLNSGNEDGLSTSQDHCQYHAKKSYTTCLNRLIVLEKKNPFLRNEFE